MFPEVNELAECLYNYSLSVEEGTELDVRLQVTEDTWRIWSGDPQYDTDHTGWWGDTVLTADDDKNDCVAKADEMIQAAREHYAMEHN